MDGSETICVTGASGLIGRLIVLELKARGKKVRALSRSGSLGMTGVECFTGDLNDGAALKRFLVGSNALFHCAGEVTDQKKMYDVNVMGTKNLYQAAAGAGLKYFCHISSAGVVGKTKQKWVDEDSLCNPQNEYEQSKYEAEKIVQKKIPNCTTVILRPINVIDEERPGVFSLPIRNALKDRLVATIKGTECAHVVHAQHVAECAVFFMSKVFDRPEIFFVGIDEDHFNTYKGIYDLFTEMSGQNTSSISWAFPIWVPYMIRRLTKENANWGDVKYSSGKLASFGFKHEWTLKHIAGLMAKHHS